MSIGDTPDEGKSFWNTYLSMAIVGIIFGLSSFGF